MLLLAKSNDSHETRGLGDSNMNLVETLVSYSHVFQKKDMRVSSVIRPYHTEANQESFISTKSQYQLRIPNFELSYSVSLPPSCLVTIRRLD
jgi:UV DNA damage repair endonuclease